MRGRKPIPHFLKLIRGTARTRKPPPDMPQPELGCTMPGYLSPGARKHWRAMVAKLDAARVLTELDADALALFCESAAQNEQAQRRLAAEGPVVLDRFGAPVINPWFKVAQSSQQKMQALLVEFGATPSSRARVTPVPAAKRGRLLRILRDDEGAPS